MARKRRAVIAVIVFVVLGARGWEQGTNDCTPQDLRTQLTTDDSSGSGKGVRGRAIVMQLRNLAQTTLMYFLALTDAHDSLNHNGSMEAESGGTGRESAALDAQAGPSTCVSNLLLTSS
ncbi:hypothetical protein Hypma_010470 [Hypsizygus marmoreus]|uniref:Uncharacterized protein n=1 Tax=Hypsizygus marmoreus TaxID=39966 RepID=A0A369JRK5_HYPMA|nr:hypothetical protein Hypma_010470 [Hypsizygus marmoreus]